jgi:PKD repeat protein
MRRKERFLGIFVAIVSIAIIISLSLVSSSFTVSNSSFQKSYVYSENLKGWINISMSNVPYNSLFTFNEKNISVLDLLKQNLAEGEYNCSIAGCEKGYSASNSNSQKNFNLNVGNDALFGLKISDKSLSYINSLVFVVNSNSFESCSAPLSVDILDDGVVDWVSNSASSSFCARNNGCFDSSDSLTPIVNGKEYCEKFSLNAFPNLKVNAKVYGKDTANFQMHIFDDDNSLNKFCSFSLSSVSSPAARESGCFINQSRAFPSNVTVCLSTTSSAYSIYYEDANPCGYVDYDIEDYQNDFSISIDPLAYGVISNLVLNTSTLPTVDFSSYTKDYCSSGCILPVKISSFRNGQNINLSSALLSYTASGLLKTSSSLYDLSLEPSKISMNYKKIFFDDSGLLVPDSSGSFFLPLKLDDANILTLNVSILALPNIIGVRPVEGSAAAPITFYANVNGGNITSYVWNFGDNSEVIQTTTNKVKHTYSAVGNYTITLNVSNSKGTTSENFNVNILSPETFINQTIINQVNKLNSLKNKIISLPAIVKSFVELTLNLTEAETTLQNAKVAFNNAQYEGNEDEYITIMSSLYNINLPSSINITSSDSGTFVLDESKIKLSDITGITKETTDYNEEEVRKAIFNWYVSNINVNAQTKTYSAINDEQIEPLGTYVSLDISALKSLERVFFVINQPASNVYGLSVVNNGAVSSQDIEIPSSISKEFMIAGAFNILDLPIYFSPLISSLEFGVDVEPCNYNNICEKDKGENSGNCKNDCKPWGKAILWIIIALVMVFILYIIVQEWYKKRYEDYLFKDKNELYNLINFINNAEKQGFQRQDIMKKLREKGWNSEKVVYAYKKFKGERTGMLEIPVLRFLEKRKIEVEIEKRKMQNNRTDLPSNFRGNFANQK